MKRNSLFLILFITGFIPFLCRGQQAQFEILKGASQSILATYYDRDSSILYTYDKSGTVIAWDIANMYPIRSFGTVPFNIWREAADYEIMDAVIEANSSKIWITAQGGAFGSKNGIYDCYFKNGIHYAQTDTANTIERIHLLKNDKGVVMSRCREQVRVENGQITYGQLINYNNVTDAIKTVALPGIVTALQVSDDEKYVAVGYRFGGVDVFTLTDLQKVISSAPGKSQSPDDVAQIRFLKDNKGVVYSYKTGSAVHIQHMNNSATESATLEKENTLKAEVSPSGKYMVVYNQYSVAMYNLETTSFEKKEIAKDYAFRTNAVTFLTDDILLFAGSSYAGYESVYSVGVPDKACLVRVNWRTNSVSTNRSFDVQNRNLLSGELSAITDSTFKLGKAGQFVHYLEPGRLFNSFYGTDHHPIINDDALGGIANARSEHPGEFALEETGQNKSELARSTTIKSIEGFVPVREHTGAQLILWRPNDPFQYTYIVSNYKGDILLRDTTDVLTESTARFSPDGKWFCIQPNCTEIKLYSTANFKQKKTIKTGLTSAMYQANKLQFNSASTKLAYEQFDVRNLNNFTLVATSLQTGKTDTIGHYGVKPAAYSLSPSFEQLALSFPFNITDTSLMRNPEHLAEAARYGFRNVFKPTIFFVDLKADALTTFIVKNTMPVIQMAATTHGVTALQKDGSLYYYNTSDTSHVLTQWLYGNDFAVMDNDHYYATRGAIERISMKNGSSAYPIGEQDIFYNQPGRIIASFGSKRYDAIRFYEQAHKKRLLQYPDKIQQTVTNDVPDVFVDKSISGQFSTNDSVLKFPVRFGKGNAVSKLIVTVNGYTVYGKKGLAVPAGPKEATVNIPLEKGENDIRIQAIDSKGSFAKPIILDYTADYKKPVAKGRLWILSAGVSRYADSTYNLKYAAKDAGDFVKVFSFKDNYDTVIIKTLVNEEVSAKSISDELHKAGSLGTNDVVIVYLAGHGLLDKDAGFYFATHDIDFHNPAGKGLSYQELLAVLEELPSRNKVLFLDACHSGLVDKSRFKASTPPKDPPAGKLMAQSTRGLAISNIDNNTSEQDVFLFMQQVFSDLSQDNNVSVLAASLGNSYALENDKLQNGLFTYCLIKGIGLAEAQKQAVQYSITTAKSRKYGEGSFFSITDIKNYLYTEVTKLSNGKQVPNFSLSRNAEHIGFVESDMAIYTYDFDYKPYDMKDYKPSKETLYRTFLDRYKSESGKK